MKNDEKIEELDNTFVNDVNQKSAVAKKLNNGEPKKKSNIPLIILLVIIAFGLGAIVSYFITTYNNKCNIILEEEKEDEGSVKKEKEIVLDTNSNLINNLITRYDLNGYDIDNYEVLYSKDEILLSDLNQDYIKQVGIMNIPHNIPSFGRSELKKSIDELFGENRAKYDDSDVKFNECLTYKYTDNFYVLDSGNGCGGTTDTSLERKIVKASKDDKRLYIDLAVAVIKGEKVYKDYSLDEKIGVDEVANEKDFDIENDYDKVNTFRYTFKYDEDNLTYFLESIRKNA